MASLHGFAIAISDGILMPEKLRWQIAIHQKFQVHSVAIMTIPLFICYFSFFCHAIKSKRGNFHFYFDFSSRVFVNPQTRHRDCVAWVAVGELNSIFIQSNGTFEASDVKLKAFQCESFGAVVDDVSLGWVLVFLASIMS